VVVDQKDPYNHGEPSLRSLPFSPAVGAQTLIMLDKRLSRRDLWEPDGETPSGYPTKS
jgi:hypothetical protein